MTSEIYPKIYNKDKDHKGSLDTSCNKDFPLFLKLYPSKFNEINPSEMSAIKSK